MNIERLRSDFNFLLEPMQVNQESRINELWRVYLTKKAILSQLSESDILNIEKEQQALLLYQVMQQVKQSILGPFYFAPEFFARLYQAGKDLDPLDYLLLEQHYKEGSPKCVPAPLFMYWRELLRSYRGKRVMLLEPLKFWSMGLAELLEDNADIQFILVEEKPVVAEILRDKLRGLKNINICVQNMYASEVSLPAADLILANPFFGKTGDILRSRQFHSDNLIVFFLTNLLANLSLGARVQAVIPVNITFNGEFLPLREQFSKDSQMSGIWDLPTAHEQVNLKLRKLLIEFTGGAPRAEALLRLGRLEIKGERLIAHELDLIKTEDFIKEDNWPLPEGENSAEKWILAYQQQANQVELGQALIVLFRGRYLSRKEGQIKESAEGNFYYINVGDIKGGELDLSPLEPMDLKLQFTAAELEKIQILPGDILIPCRGTVLKIAQAPQTLHTLLASANVLVLRVDKAKLDADYLQLFLESPLGMALLKGIERGSQSINLNPGDIEKIKIPLPPLARQKELVLQYQRAKGLRDEKLKLIEKQFEEDLDKVIKGILT